MRVPERKHWVTHRVTSQCGKLRTAPVFVVEERHLTPCLFPRPFTLPVFHCRAETWFFSYLTRTPRLSSLPPSCCRKGRHLLKSSPSATGRLSSSGWEAGRLTPNHFHLGWDLWLLFLTSRSRVVIWCRGKGWNSVCYSSSRSSAGTWR